MVDQRTRLLPLLHGPATLRQVEERVNCGGERLSLQALGQRLDSGVTAEEGERSDENRLVGDGPVEIVLAPRSRSGGHPLEAVDGVLAERVQTSEQGLLAVRLRLVRIREKRLGQGEGIADPDRIAERACGEVLHLLLLVRVRHGGDVLGCGGVVAGEGLGAVCDRNHVTGSDAGLRLAAHVGLFLRVELFVESIAERCGVGVLREVLPVVLGDEVGESFERPAKLAPEEPSLAERGRRLGSFHEELCRGWPHLDQHLVHAVQAGLEKGALIHVSVRGVERLPGVVTCFLLARHELSLELLKEDSLPELRCEPVLFPELLGSCACRVEIFWCPEGLASEKLATFLDDRRLGIEQGDEIRESFGKLGLA